MEEQQEHPVLVFLMEMCFMLPDLNQYKPVPSLSLSLLHFHVLFSVCHITDGLKSQTCSRSSVQNVPECVQIYLTRLAGDREFINVRRNHVHLPQRLHTHHRPVHYSGVVFNGSGDGLSLLVDSVSFKIRTDAHDSKFTVSL